MLIITAPLDDKFWRSMAEKYPKASKAFMDFTIEYREASGLTYDFDVERTIRGLRRATAPASVKMPFYDYPFAFQFGIWFEFMKSRRADKITIDPQRMKFDEAVADYFERIEIAHRRENETVNVKP